MKTTNLRSLAIIALITISHTLFSQIDSEKIWVTIENASNVPTHVDGKLISTNPEIQTLITAYNITGVEQAVPSSRRQALRNIYEIECNCDAIELSKTIEQKISSLTHPEPAPKYELLSDPDDYSLAIPNDYALDLINAKGAWQYSTGDSTTVIGISDGNFYTNHEELVNKYDHVDFLNTSTYYYQHGTAVAVTAAGNTNNSIGKSSIGYNCRLDLRGMSYDKVLQLSYAGRKVVNLSWTSGCSNSAYTQSIVDEVYDNGTILVVAAGNGSTCGGASNLVYPAACNHTIAVSSVGPTDNHEGVIGDPASAHQHNSSVDICAPGYLVGLTVGPGWYMNGNGTSFAAPYVSGTIGLMLSLKPCLTYDDVLSILVNSAKNIDAQNPNYLGMLGAGRLDAKFALQLTSMFTCSGLDNGNVGLINSDLDTITSIADEIDNQQDPSNHNIQHRIDNLSTSETMGMTTFEETAFEVNLFPNPSVNSTRIMWNMNEEMTLKVVDVNGSVVYQKAITTEMNETTLDIQEKGLFFIQLEKEGRQKWIGKLVRI